MCKCVMQLVLASYLLPASIFLLALHLIGEACTGGAFLLLLLLISMPPLQVLTSTDVLNKFNISMKKRIVALMKGLKQKAANVDSPEVSRARAQLIWDKLQHHSTPMARCEGACTAGSAWSLLTQELPDG